MPTPPHDHVPGEPPASPAPQAAGHTLLERYLFCRQAVIDAGYSRDIDYYTTRTLDTIQQAEFLLELGWVVLNSGMRNTVCQRLWPRLRAVFLEFSDLPALQAQCPAIRAAALAILNHPGKIDAILAAADRVQHESWATVKREIQRHGITVLRRFQYIGPVLCHHLGKNLGLPVAKPDRHLVRIATAAGYGTDVQRLCQDLAADSGDPVSVVDYVLWRTASTLMPDYPVYFS
jgi:hypothetical protein